MAINIIASKLESFTEIKEIVDSLGNFTDNFQTAEFRLSGYRALTLTANYNSNDISLPKGFIISEVVNESHSDYELDTEGNIKEKKIFGIEIRGRLDEQEYTLVYKNLYRSDIKIMISRN